MLGNLVLFVTFMASFISTSLPSQYTVPASFPLRFDLPGSDVNVRNTFHSNVTDIDNDVDQMRDVDNIFAHPKRNTKHRIVVEENEDFSLFSETHQQYKHPSSKWTKTSPKGRRGRYKKRGNTTSGRFPSKKKTPTNRPGWKRSGVSEPRRKVDDSHRKFNSTNRVSSGVPAAGRYRSVDPRQKKVRRHILRFHNILRSHVEPSAADMLAVGWYDTAAEQAQAWAEQCGAHTYADHPSVRWTSRYGACGQNVLVAQRKRRWSYVLRRWWSGKRYFVFGEESNNSSVVSAYTQMAWYNSHQVGCGFSECSTTGGVTFFRYVCNYCPSGNDPRRLSRPYTRGQTCRRCPRSCKSICSRGQCKLCTNACTYSDLWNNCATLNTRWHEWLCNTKTSQGVERFMKCRATCQCRKRIT